MQQAAGLSSRCLPSPCTCLPALSPPAPRAFLLQAGHSWSVWAHSKKRCAVAKHLRSLSPPMPPLPGVWGPGLFLQVMLGVITTSCQTALCSEMFCSRAPVLTVNNLRHFVTLTSSGPSHISLPGALMTVLRSLFPARKPRGAPALICHLLPEK